MRETKFRGLRIDGEGWAYGYLCMLDLEICPALAIGIDKRLLKGVKPDTVCESTGLKDKFGNEIFEGDIIKSWNNKKPKIIWTHEVYWAGLGFGFRCITASDGNKILSCTMLHARESNVEIIGNIHEHKHLLI